MSDHRDSLPRSLAESFITQEYPFVAEAYARWVMNPVKCVKEGVASIPEAYQPLMEQVLHYFLRTENTLLAGNVDEQGNLLAGTRYHRHPLQTFHLATRVVDHLRTEKGVPIAQGHKLCFALAMLLHDYQRVFKRETSKDVTSQMVLNSDLKTVLVASPAYCALVEQVRDFILHTMVKFTEQTNYSGQGQWLSFLGPHEVIFRPPNELPQVNPTMSSEEVISLLLPLGPWCDIVSQLILPGYRQLRRDDLDFDYTLPIPDGFKELVSFGLSPRFDLGKVLDKEQYNNLMGNLIL